MQARSHPGSVSSVGQSGLHVSDESICLANSQLLSKESESRLRLMDIGKMCSDRPFALWIITENQKGLKQMDLGDHHSEIFLERGHIEIG